jgi:hypothetical protein
MYLHALEAWSSGMVSSPSVNEESGAMGREIESRQGAYMVVVKKHWCTKVTGEHCMHVCSMNFVVPTYKNIFFGIIVKN